MKTALVLGAGGFIGSHMVKKLKKEGFWVRGVDLKRPEFSKTEADDFIIGDLRDISVCRGAMFDPYQISLIDKQTSFDEVYQFAADMGGAGYIFTGENDANVMHNSAQINLNICDLSVKYSVKKIFYSSSACMYPEYQQVNTRICSLPESCAYPAAPDSEYGWEKLFSERLYLAYNRNYGLQVRIARFHNIFGPEGTWVGGKEKAPAALCRKIAMAKDGKFIDIWGDGEQTRSFLYIDECIEGIRRLMNCETFMGPVNIGSDEMISINNLAKMIINISGKIININHIEGPTGVRGRNSDNFLIKKELGWAPSQPLRNGIEKTYKWIREQVNKHDWDEFIEKT